MSYETKDNSATLFKVENRKSDKHPEYNGNARIDGHDYFIDAWVNESKSGKKYFAIKFKKKDGALRTEKPDYSKSDFAKNAQALKAQEPIKQSFQRDLSDEIPFKPEFR